MLSGSAWNVVGYFRIRAFLSYNTVTISSKEESTMSVTQHPPLHQDKEPIRLFKSDFLEAFTHIHPAVVLIIWVPVVIVCLVLSVVNSAAGADSTFPWHIPLGYLVGLAAWTLAEYNVHRFVFHFRPRTAWQERLSFLFHGVHHHQPQCKTRLVMPPAVSIPMAVIFYAFFYLVLSLLLGAWAWVLPVFAGFLTGYIIYDMIHYATHHSVMRAGVWKFLKRHHMLHHFKTPNARYGVSSPLWDYVFGTMPA
jgi:sterol desaturase/sphingolipid hydroxylase (fatty acid hydroxylase superfamily)